MTTTQENTAVPKKVTRIEYNTYIIETEKLIQTFLSQITIGRMVVNSQRMKNTLEKFKVTDLDRSAATSKPPVYILAQDGVRYTSSRYCQIVGDTLAFSRHFWTEDVVLSTIDNLLTFSVSTANEGKDRQYLINKYLIWSKEIEVDAKNKACVTQGERIDNLLAPSFATLPPQAKTEYDRIATGFTKFTFTKVKYQDFWDEKTYAQMVTQIIQTVTVKPKQPLDTTPFADAADLTPAPVALPYITLEQPQNVVTPQEAKTEEGTTSKDQGVIQMTHKIIHSTKKVINTSTGVKDVDIAADKWVVAQRDKIMVPLSEIPKNDGGEFANALRICHTMGFLQQQSFTKYYDAFVHLDKFFFRSVPLMPTDEKLRADVSDLLCMLTLYKITALYPEEFCKAEWDKIQKWQNDKNDKLSSSTESDITPVTPPKINSDMTDTSIPLSTIKTEPTMTLTTNSSAASDVDANATASRDMYDFDDVVEGTQPQKLIDDKKSETPNWVFKGDLITHTIVKQSEYLMRMIHEAEKALPYYEDKPTLVRERKSRYKKGANGITVTTVKHPRPTLTKVVRSTGGPITHNTVSTPLRYHDTFSYLYALAYDRTMIYRISKDIPVDPEYMHAISTLYALRDERTITMRKLISTSINSEYTTEMALDGQYVGDYADCFRRITELTPKLTIKEVRNTARGFVMYTMQCWGRSVELDAVGDEEPYSRRKYIFELDMDLDWKMVVPCVYLGAVIGVASASVP
jgi:hypothetical protein